MYALLFENGCCYIGQSTDLKRREHQHRHHSGGWLGQPFTMVPLSTINGTKAQAEDHEYAWRYVAVRNGWRVYGKPPNIRVNTVLRMNSRRHAIARQCSWPAQQRGGGFFKWIALAAGLVGALIFLARF